MMVLRVVAGYTKFVDCNPLTALIRFVLYLLYNLFLHCCEAFGKILTNTPRPAVHVRCQSFLLSNNIGGSRIFRGGDFGNPSERALIIIINSFV